MADIPDEWLQKAENGNIKELAKLISGLDYGCLKVLFGRISINIYRDGNNFLDEENKKMADLLFGISEQLYSIALDMKTASELSKPTTP